MYLRIWSDFDAFYFTFDSYIESPLVIGALPVGFVCVCVC